MKDGKRYYAGKVEEMDAVFDVTLRGPVLLAPSAEEAQRVADALNKGEAGMNVPQVSGT